MYATITNVKLQYIIIHVICVTSKVSYSTYVTIANYKKVNYSMYVTIDKFHNKAL